MAATSALKLSLFSSPVSLFPSSSSLRTSPSPHASLPRLPFRSASDFKGGCLKFDIRTDDTFRTDDRTVRRRISVFSQAGDSDTSNSVELAAAVGGVVSVPIVAWSLYTLKTTGCGLPPGPGGSLGALEGISYLVILGIVGWSAYTKYKTGSGLPNGPFGLLGASEGLSYLTLLIAIVVFGLQLTDYGFIPPPIPGDQCFG